MGKNDLDFLKSVKNLLETARDYGEEDFLLTAPRKTAEVPTRAGFSVVSDDVSISPASLKKEEIKSEGSLESLYQKYAECQNCSLAKSRKKIVFGVGALHPKVLFIGEGPGYEEDRQGLPFVGKAGQLLDKIMASIGLNRENSYIANIVKCHPMKDPSQPDLRGNDRAPDDQEMAACKEILEQQIEILNPPVICALGSVSAKFLLKSTDGITRLRGKLFNYEFPVSKKIVPLIPTYHPAALLRNPELKKEVWQDMKLLKKVMESNG